MQTLKEKVLNLHGASSQINGRSTISMFIEIQILCMLAEQTGVF